MKLIKLESDYHDDENDGTGFARGFINALSITGGVLLLVALIGALLMGVHAFGG